MFMQSLPEICQFNAKRQKAGEKEGSCSRQQRHTHRNELQSCLKLFFSFLARATALCNRGCASVSVCLSRSAAPSPEIQCLSVKTMCPLSPSPSPLSRRRPRGNLATSCRLGHKLQHFGYQHLVTLHLAKTGLSTDCAAALSACPAHGLFGGK